MLFDLFKRRDAASAGSGKVNTGRPNAMADYMRGNMSPFMLGWRPALREPAEDVRRSWTDAAARVTDAIHNSGFLAGGIDQAVTNINGIGLRLNLTPDPGIFGGQSAANKWAREVERRWNDYSNNRVSCDLTGRYTVAQMCAQGLRSYFATGEMLATLPYVERPGSSHGTKVNMLPSNRLVQRGSDPAVVQGVRLDFNGMPTGYVFSVRNLVTGAVEEKEIAALDATGRQQVIHIFEGVPTTTRGITPLAPALQIVRQIDQLQNSTLTTALIQAIFAASIESDAPTEEVMEAMRSQSEQIDLDTNPGLQAPTSGFDSLMFSRLRWYGKTKIDLGQFGKVFHAFPGEKLMFHTPNHPGANYKDFLRMLNRELARCLGITYEQLTLDNEGATYSSLNNETADIHSITMARRVALASRFMHAVFSAWLEEDIERGNTKFPGGMEAFQRQRVQASRADWQGPPRPPADEKKAAEANEVKLRNKAITRGQWCAELGTNWQDVDEQELQEQENREDLGLPPVTPVTNTTPNLPNGGRPTGSGAAADDPPADPADDPEKED